LLPSKFFVIFTASISLNPLSRQRKQIALYFNGINSICLSDSITSCSSGTLKSINSGSLGIAFLSSFIQSSG